MPGYQQTYEMQRAAVHPPQQHPGSYDQITVTPLTGALGARVEGIDLADLDDAGFAEVERALVDHLVLTFPGQDLEPAAQVAFARRFGPLMDYPFAKTMAEHPEVTELISEPDDMFNFGGSWHTDSPNFELPPKITMTYCAVAPETGGDTSFANQYLAWETLSDGMRRLLEPMTAMHSTALAYGQDSAVGQTAFKAQTSTPTGIGGNAKHDDEFEHPVARTHPDTGRKALYVCDSYAARFAGMTQEESLPLLRYLWAHAILPEFTCRVHWQAGTLTMWDNRCAMHYAHNDYSGQRRVMRRIIVEGEKPV